MTRLRPRTFAEQVADHLKVAILRGGFRDLLPGKMALAAQLGVNHKTITEAVTLLEREGLLIAQGPGRRRRISETKGTTTGLRIGLFLYEPADRQAYDVLDLRERLLAAGHSIRIPSRSLTELGMNARRVARVTARSSTDAWVVLSASREVLQWFSAQPIPIIAYAGAFANDLPIAGVAPDKNAATGVMMRRLIALGHRRIMYLSRGETRPSRFLGELEAHGIQTGPYNMPQWGKDGVDLQRCLDSLFATSPPTAIYIDEAPVFVAAQGYLARRGIHSPEHVSLVCADPSPCFEWCRPTVAHIRWDSAPVVTRILRWVDGVARGKKDHRRIYTPSEFVDGGTVGPVPDGVERKGSQ